MTLIIAHSALPHQILIADRLITNMETGEPLDANAYKLINYRNDQQGYQVGIAYTGLAFLSDGFNTFEWLVEMLPQTLDSTTPLDEGLVALSEASTIKFSTLRSARRKHVTFVFAGHAARLSPHPEPFCAVVSNCMDEAGSQTADVESVFRARIWDRRRVPHQRRFNCGLIRGDLRELRRYWIETRSCFRRLRCPMSPEEKIRLAVELIRRYSRTSQQIIGSDLLSLTLFPSGESEGGDWPLSPRESFTMPCFLTADGALIRNFVVTPYRPSISQSPGSSSPNGELSDRRNRRHLPI